MLCCMFSIFYYVVLSSMSLILQSSDSLMDLYRIYNEEESLKRFKKKLRRSRERITAEL
jgi:hypothetical protein